MSYEEFYKFECECGGEEFRIIPKQQYYRCFKCDTAYTMHFVPFDVFNPGEKMLIKAGDPKVGAICSEVALKRLLMFHDPRHRRFQIAGFQQSGCYDIHTISECLNTTLKYQVEDEDYDPYQGYGLLYRRPFEVQVMEVSELNTNRFSHPDLYGVIMRYLHQVSEPLIVSGIPKSNWKRMMSLLYQGENFWEVYRKSLHTVLIVGISIHEGPQQRPLNIYIHNHINNIPIKDQQPYEAVSMDKFEYAHTLADFRSIMNLRKLLLRDNLKNEIFQKYQIFRK